jgi:hypothetical protein
MEAERLGRKVELMKLGILLKSRAEQQLKINNRSSLNNVNNEESQMMNTMGIKI